MEFKELARLCEELEATTKRNLMVSRVASFLKKLERDEVEPAVSLLLGRPLPKWSGLTLDVSWTTVMQVLKTLTKAGDEEISKAFRKTGDLGSTAQLILENRRPKRQAGLMEEPLTIMEARRYFQSIAEASGPGSRAKKLRLLSALLSRATPLEAKYIVKAAIGEMRTGFSRGLMELAVSRAFGVRLDVVRKASMLLGDVAEAASLAAKKGKDALLAVKPTPFRPIKPMLAQPAETLEQALKEHGGKTALEYKLDGARVQIHKKGGKVRIYSRRLTDVTESLPEVATLTLSQLGAGEAIVEGEVIAVGEDGAPLPFQQLMRRFRRKRGIEREARRVSVQLYLFDLLYVDGQSLIDCTYSDRRLRLREIAGQIPLTPQLITDSPEEAEAFLKSALEQGHEGLMAKRLDSPYTPGIRGKHWLKIKPTLEPLDLVIVAAEYGYGRRKNWLSDYYLAARDEKTGEFLVVGKTFKGLTDEEFEEMTRRLLSIAVRREGHRVYVKPEIVVEVAYNEIQKSPKYRCGMALRFARITKIRWDKPPEEADTIERVREIFRRQFERKASA